jgi:hypothetical protein
VEDNARVWASFNIKYKELFLLYCDIWVLLFFHPAAFLLCFLFLRDLVWILRRNITTVGLKEQR